MNRRELIASTAALPFAGAAALAPAAAAAAEDPAVVAFRTWRAADDAHRTYLYDVCRGDWSDDDPEERRLHDAEWSARKALAETIATTPAGMACQLRLAFDLFADQTGRTNPDDLERYRFGAWAEDLDGKVMRNMLAGAERLAGRVNR